MEEFVLEAGVRLAEVAARNTASIVLDRVRLARERRGSAEVVNDLVGIINELIDDKNELLQIANVQGGRRRALAVGRRHCLHRRPPPADAQ